MSIKIENYSSGEVRKEYHRNHVGLHRIDGPALIHYDKEGGILSEKWYQNDRLHRMDGPAVYEVKVHQGKIEWIYKYLQNHKLHREDGPAYLIFTEYKDKLGKKISFNSYHINGRPVCQNEYTVWQLNNILKPHYISLLYRAGNITVNQYGEIIKECKFENLESYLKQLLTPA